MRLVFTFWGKFYPTDASPDEPLHAIVGRVSNSVRVAASLLDVSWKGRIINDLSATPRTLGMQENEMLDLQNKIGVQTSQAVGEAPAQNQPSAQVQNPEAIRNAMKNFQISNIVRNLGRGGAAPTQQRQAAPRQPQQPRIQIPDPDVFRAEVMSTPNLLQQMLHNDPLLAEALLAEDNTLLVGILQERALAKQLAQQKEDAEINRLNANPYDQDAQAMIEERIRQENVLNNMETAMEHHPESFGRVIMLYIPCVVNNVPVQAFVDSGAQNTIMSVECAKRCGIMRLVDTRFAGVAQGVGSAPIIGKVHLAQIKIGDIFFPCSFTILDGAKQQLDFLLGLDMLKRHQCNINLRENVLQIGTQNIPFLSEGQIEEKMATEATPEEEQRILDSQKSHLPMSIEPPSTTPAGVDNKAEAPGFPEDKINLVMGMGYTRQDAIEALSVADGNADGAVAYLLERR